MFELPSLDNIVKVVIEENVITEAAKPILIYADGENQSLKRMTANP